MTDSEGEISLHPNFSDNIQEIKELDLNLPEKSERSYNFDSANSSDQKVEILEDELVNKISISEGRSVFEENKICGYDESIQEYSTIEGKGVLTSHCVVVHGETDYQPFSMINFKFYTKANDLKEQSNLVQVTDEGQEIGELKKENYAVNRKAHMIENVPDDSIVVVDGPLIGGQISHHTIQTARALSENGTISVFVVKNTSSSLVIDNLDEINNSYNSDDHWAYDVLSEDNHRTRTSFFQYTDMMNSDNTKVFTYLMPFDQKSPIRVEFDTKTYQENSETCQRIADMITYLIVCHGERQNPQPRTVKIAENFARASLELVDIEELMEENSSVPIINQDRF